MDEKQFSDMLNITGTSFKRMNLALHIFSIANGFKPMTEIATNKDSLRFKLIDFFEENEIPVTMSFGRSDVLYPSILGLKYDILVTRNTKYDRFTNVTEMFGYPEKLKHNSNFEYNFFIIDNLDRRFNIHDHRRTKYKNEREMVKKLHDIFKKLDIIKSIELEITRVYDNEITWKPPEKIKMIKYNL